MPQILKKETQKGFVVVWEMTESLEELLKEVQLSTEEQIKIKSFKLDTRKQEFATSRFIIQKTLNIIPQVSYLPSGKPVLYNSDYKISISHTKGYVAVAFSKREFAGVDIEFPSDRVSRVYTRFVSDEEQQFIPENQKKEYYTLLWCLKEAMYKMYDRKSSIFNVNFVCHPFQIQKEGSISASFCFETNETMGFNYIVDEHFYLVYHC